MADARSAVGAEGVRAAVEAEPERSAELAVFEFDAGGWHWSFHWSRKTEKPCIRRDEGASDAGLA